MNSPTREFVPDDERCHVLLAPGTELDPRTIAAPLAAVLGGTVVDRATAIRYGHGWVARSVAPAFAHRALECVEAVGAAGFVVPDRGLPDVPPVCQVLAAVLEDQHLECVTRASVVPLPLSTIACADLAVLGRAGASREAKAEWQRARSKRKRRADADDDWRLTSDWNLALEASSQAAHPFSLALRESDLEQAEPRLFLVTRDPVEILGIDRSTRFPAVGALAGLAPSAAWFHFVDRLLPSLAHGKVLPEAAHAWAQRLPSAIEMHRRESLSRRLSWLVQLVTHDLWEDFR